jgi:hypothetical protein
VRQRFNDAIEHLERVVTTTPPGPLGWLIPIEPLLEPLKDARGYDRVLTVLRTRAR